MKHMVKAAAMRSRVITPAIRKMATDLDGDFSVISLVVVVVIFLVIVVVIFMPHNGPVKPAAHLHEVVCFVASYKHNLLFVHGFGFSHFTPQCVFGQTQR